MSWRDALASPPEDTASFWFGALVGTGTYSIARAAYPGVDVFVFTAGSLLVLAAAYLGTVALVEGDSEGMYVDGDDFYVDEDGNLRPKSESIDLEELPLSEDLKPDAEDHQLDPEPSE